MLQAPERLFAKASALGFECVTNLRVHKIAPSAPSDNWHLLYQAGDWTLVINGAPQMTMQYAEVSSFLERRAKALARAGKSDLVNVRRQLRMRRSA